MNALYHVLHVEDDPNDVLLVRRAFRIANQAVTLESVNNGESAVAYLSGSDIYSDRARFPLPTLILLDWKIPRKSGLEVLAWLRTQPTLKRLPVTVLTSSRHEKDIRQAYETGANSYLVKPVGFDVLLQIVKTINSYWLELNQKPTVPA